MRSSSYVGTAVHSANEAGATAEQRALNAKKRAPKVLTDNTPTAEDIARRYDQAKAEGNEMLMEVLMDAWCDLSEASDGFR